MTGQSANRRRARYLSGREGSNLAACAHGGGSGQPREISRLRDVVIRDTKACLPEFVSSESARSFHNRDTPDTPTCTPERYVNRDTPDTLCKDRGYAQIRQLALQNSKAEAVSRRESNFACLRAEWAAGFARRPQAQTVIVTQSVGVGLWVCVYSHSAELAAPCFMFAPRLF